MVPFITISASWAAKALPSAILPDEWCEETEKAALDRITEGGCGW
jgi:hypothetical protein